MVSRSSANVGYGSEVEVSLALLHVRFVQEMPSIYCAHLSRRVRLEA